ncbi:MAG TPA: hypothetical protein PKL31_10430 [Fulvivirga sp.]|nr:hypothetical protein [Fulvivirga sp.]
MMKRLRSNNGLLNKTRRQRVKDAYTHVSLKMNLTFKTASKEDLKLIREKVIKERKKTEIRTIISVLLTIITIPIIIYISIKILNAFLT